VSLMNVSKGLRAFSSVPDSPEGQQWVYQSSRPFQLSATEIGFMTQIRPGGAGTVDLSFGNDLLVTSDLNEFAISSRHVIDRPRYFQDPRDGRDLVGSVHWNKGGFVPLGAKRPDGSPHPHGGTGFGGSVVVGYPAAYETKLAEDVFENWEDYEPTRGIENPVGKKSLAIHPFPYRETRLYQFRYDGECFDITRDEPFELEGFKPDIGWALRHDVPDGDDLLYPFTATPIGDDCQVCGVARWRRLGEAWAIVDTMIVPGAENSYEPSLERGRNGQLFFTCRAAFEATGSRSIRVWVSDDGAATWKKIIDVPEVRSSSPTTINRSPDGTLFILGNPVESNRQVLAAWPLSPAFDRLQEPIVVLDSAKEVGLFRGEYDWYADHPIGSVLRLANGELRGIITHRFANRIEVGYDLPPTPSTSTCLYTVRDDGCPLETWNF
jgi:hypothetical protein